MKWYTWIRKCNPLRSKRRQATLQLLQQQRFLLYKGVPGKAEVLESFAFDQRLSGYTLVRMWVRLYIQTGTIVFTYTEALVNKKHIPAVGDTLQVKCLPDDLSNIVILT